MGCVLLTIIGYLHYFLIGILLADAKSVDSGVSDRRWDIVCAAAVSCFFASRALLPGEWYYAPIFGLAIFAALRGRWCLMALRSRWVCALGGMCYTIYLYHAWILAFGAKALSRIYLNSQPLWVNCCIQFPILAVATLAVCLPLYVYIERPCMNRSWPANVIGWIKDHYPKKC